MAAYDPARAEIVLRVVYDGFAGSGKTTNLHALYDAFTLRAADKVWVPAQTRSGRTLFFDWLELEGGFLGDWPLRCQVLSVPGQFALAEKRFVLLHDCDAVVLVVESTTHGVATARVARCFLDAVRSVMPGGGPGYLVQANKRDLPRALPLDALAGLLAPVASPPPRVLEATARTGDGVRETFLAALDLARDRLRPLLAAGLDPRTLPPPQTADALYATLRDGQARDASHLAEALEAALEMARSLEQG